MSKEQLYKNIDGKTATIQFRLKGKTREEIIDMLHKAGRQFSIEKDTAIFNGKRFLMLPAKPRTGLVKVKSVQVVVDDVHIDKRDIVLTGDLNEFRTVNGSIINIQT